MTYPTAADLRQAANEANLKRCDDPLLSKIMEAAKYVASKGAMSYRVVLPDPDDDDQFERLVDACRALGIRCDDVSTEDGTEVFELRWD
jgi:hypothetical protein